MKVRKDGYNISTSSTWKIFKKKNNKEDGPLKEGLEGDVKVGWGGWAGECGGRLDGEGEPSSAQSAHHQPSLSSADIQQDF